MDKCLDIIQQFRGDKITKSKATILLQQAIPHESLKEASFISTYGSYLEMLDNFESCHEEVSVSNIETPLLLARLSEPDHPPRTQATMTTSTSDEYISTTDPCLGTVQMWHSLQSQNYLPLFKKPKPCSRISLGMSTERGHLYSTATELYPNSLNQNGSACSVAIPSTSTTSSPTSIPSPMMIENPSSLANTSNYSMEPQPQPELLKRMAIGSLRGKQRLKQHSLSSSIDNKSSPSMANTFNGSSPLSQTSFTQESSTMNL